MPSFLSEELISTEELFLLISQKHARLLRSHQNSLKDQQLEKIRLEKIRQESQILIQQASNDLIETENSRLVALEKHARELRKSKKENEIARKSQESLKEQLGDAHYELEELKEQLLGLQNDRNELKSEVLQLNEELKIKETLNKGLVDSLLKEANAHQATILQHQKDEEARIAALPKMEAHGTQTETDQLIEYMKSQIQQLSADVESLQAQNAVQQESLENISSENTYLQSQFDQQASEISSLQSNCTALDDKNHLLELKLKAANYEIEHLTTDYREMSQREAVLVDEGRQKDEIIQKLRKELEILQHRDTEAEHQINELTDQNNALSDTLKETNIALETLQNELYELRAKLKNAPNNNDLDAEEEKQKDHLFPAVQARTRSQPSSRGADDEPDEASQSYSAEGYANNVRKKAKHPGTPGTPENGYYSDSDGDTKLKKNKGDVGVKGLRAKSKKKKDHSTDSILPMINQKRGGSESVISSLSVEEKDYSDDDDRKKRKHLKSRSQLDSARDSASVAYKIAQPLADERHTKQQKLIFERQISGGCTQCGKKIKGEPKRLPSSLKNLVVDGIDSSSQVSAPKSRDSCQTHSVISEAFFAGYPILENHLDHQLAVRDKYSHPRGQHCNFCSWDCAKKWNAKNTPVNLRYETHKLICIAAGTFE